MRVNRQRWARWIEMLHSNHRRSNSASKGQITLIIEIMQLLFWVNNCIKMVPRVADSQSNRRKACSLIQRLTRHFQWRSNLGFKRWHSRGSTTGPVRLKKRYLTRAISRSFSRVQSKEIRSRVWETLGSGMKVHCKGKRRTRSALILGWYPRISSHWRKRAKIV